jgi:type IV pilus assembly protein PilV
MRIVSRVRNTNPAGRSRESGFGLIELLVAVVLLSIGLLGLAGLQLRTMRNNESSLERGMAVVETHSIIDAMRADRASATADKFDIALTASPPTGTTTFADVALAAWRTNLTRVLGDGATGAVACDGAKCTITVQWDDTRGTGGSSSMQLVTQVQL